VDEAFELDGRRGGEAADRVPARRRAEEALPLLVALQAGVNVVNDLFDDASGLDADPAFATNAFPLGSRVLQSGALLTRLMRPATSCAEIERSPAATARYSSSRRFTAVIDRGSNAARRQRAK